MNIKMIKRKRRRKEIKMRINKKKMIRMIRMINKRRYFLL